MTRILIPSRRGLLTAMGAALAAPAILRPGHAWAAEPVTVETANGRLQGLRDNGAVRFRGIPYAADTGGRNRFMAPRPVANWAGVREAVSFGPRAPQASGGPGAPPPSGPQPTFSEACCVLNVYAPDLNPNARRPVMFWIHGGGFSGGSGEVDGSNLARFGDAVVVTVNHRLNVFGYTHLGFLDPEFADATAAGQLDLIAALNWVQTNIGRFGGDPGNVTVFGQSGGGSKITTLQLMPRSKGVFHRAINMSGSSAYSMKPRLEAEQATLELLNVLGIDRRDLRKLQDVPTAALSAADAKAAQNLLAGSAPPAVRGARPTVDGRLVAHGPFSAEGLAMHASMPMIFSMTATEAAGAVAGDQRNRQVTIDQVRARLAAQYRLDDARANEVTAGYTRDDPQRTPYDVLVAACSEAWVRAGIHRGATAKANLRQAPVYVLDFNLMVDPVLGAPHSADVAYAFGNQATGARANTSPEARAVAEAHMSAFAAFARNGDPNNARIPTWRPYDTVRRPTLVMEHQPRVVDDFRGSDRRTSDSLPPQDPVAVTSGPLFRYA